MELYQQQQAHMSAAAASYHYKPTDRPAPITRSLRAGIAGTPSEHNNQHQAMQQHYVHEDGQTYISRDSIGSAGDGPDAGGYGAEDDSGLHSDDEVAEALQGQHGQGRFQYHQHGDVLDQHDEEHDHDAEDGTRVEGAEEDIDDAASFSDSLSSSPSIPDEDIDFNLVYALHTFLATVDGQASVVKGDKLLLLDDSNSYWWLVRVLKTQAIGYIPAENIETPWERLARLNKHRNVDLTSATQADVLSGPTSTAAQTRFVGRIPPWQQPHPHESRHPYSKGVPASPSHKDHPRNISPPPEDRPASSKAKTVLFTAPTYYAHSASGLTSEGESDEGFENEEGHYVEGEDEEGEGPHAGTAEDDEYADTGHRGTDGGFDDDEEMYEGAPGRGEESEFSDDQDDGPHSSIDPSRRAATAGRASHLAQSLDEGADDEEGEGDDEDAGPEARRGHSPYAFDDSTGPPPEGSSAASSMAPKTSANAASIMRREHWERERDAAAQAQQVAAAAEAQWQARDSQALSPVSTTSPRSPSRGLLSVHDLAPAVAQGPADPRLGVSLSPTQTQQSGFSSSPPSGFSTSQSQQQHAVPSSNEDSIFRLSGSRTMTDDDLLFADPEAPTKKLSATPRIARNSTSTSMSASEFDEMLGLGIGAGSGAGTAGERTSTPAAARPDASSSAGRGLPQRVRGVDLVNPRDPRYDRMLQPTKQAGEDVVYERMIAQQQRTSGALATGGGRPSSAVYAGPDESLVTGGALLDASTESTGEVDKRTLPAANDGGSDKKRKSGAGILGLFRKKDKKKKGEEDTESSSGRRLRASENSGTNASPIRGSSRRSTSSSPSLSASEPRSSADRSLTGHSGGGQVGPGPTSAESMFSTDAALRQQELEARQALFQQYGVQRAPGDVSNTMTPRGAPGVLVMNDDYGSPLSGGGSTGVSKRNSLQLLNHPGSVTSPNGALASPSSLAPNQRIRPGSLLGSPSVTGLEVPVLSVMRVFSGANIEVEATFKTVLLNQTTTAADLVKQSMQRFRLTGADVTREDFYLTVKELGGDERALRDDEYPLRIFEDLSDRGDGDESGFQLPPNVKRSSIGSINSISSNLSTHPAIARSGVNDWSDDSAVKFYLHRRAGPTSPKGDAASGKQGNGVNAGMYEHPLGYSDIAGATAQRQEHLPGSGTNNSTSGPSYRFAVRNLIHPSDLPDSVVFDPSSNAIIPRAVLAERQSRNGGFIDPSPTTLSSSQQPREKIIFFPRNANVSEVIETALDRFGIVDGVVDGGDEVEDRLNRRRSQTRVKYSLAVQRDGLESFLNSSTKLLDAYSSPPQFKAYDRSSKEFRRQSADATLILGSSSDVQPHDPVFVIRRSPVRHGAGTRSGGIPQTIDELDELQQRRRQDARIYAGDDEDDEQEVLDSSPNPEAARGKGQRDLIAAQRAAQRASQSALLSARGNDGQGFDITIPDRGTIRSSRADESDEVRYSFVHQDGTETDISDIVEHEWYGGATPTRAGPSPTPSSRPVQNMLRAASAATTTDAESFVTATGSLTPGLEDEEGEDERRAIDALRSTSIDVDRPLSPRAQPTVVPGHDDSPVGLSQSGVHHDHLRTALGPRPMTSPVMNESLQERLDRVLARVKEDKARRAASPTGSFGWRPRSYISNVGGVGGSSTSGRTSPASVSARSASALSGRRSPFGDILRDSPSIDQLVSSSQQSPRSAPSDFRTAASHPKAAQPPSGAAGHSKKASIASMSSAASTTVTDQPSTPVTGGSSSQRHFTPASSSNSNHRQAGIAFADDFGYDRLVAIVDAAAAVRPVSTPDARRDSIDERLFGRELDVAALHPEVRAAYDKPFKTLNALDARLDKLMREFVLV